MTVRGSQSFVFSQQVRGSVKLPKTPQTPVASPVSSPSPSGSQTVGNHECPQDDPFSGGSSSTPVAAPPATPLPTPISMANPTNTGTVMASASGTMPNAAMMAMNYGVSITWPPVDTTYPSGSGLA